MSGPRSPRPGALALVPLVAALACSGGESADKPTTRVDPPKSASPSAEAAPASATAEKAPDAPKPGADADKDGRFTSSDGLVSAPRPRGEGWECEERVARPPDPETTLIKCRQTTPGRFFFFMAKDYAVPEEQIRRPEGIVREVLPRTYDKLYESYTFTREEPVLVAGNAGIDLWIDAVHAKTGPIRKRERVLTQGQHVFILSAEGLPPDYEAEEAAIDAWLTGAAFKNLTEAPAAP